MKRSEKLIELSKSVPYSKEELKLLSNMVYDVSINDSILNDDFYEIYNCINDNISGKGYAIDRDSDSEEYSPDKPLNILQFLLVYFKKISLFLTCVSLENVPLYINDSQLKAFVQWRLLINK